MGKAKGNHPIFAVRKIIEMSQKEFAALVGCSTPTIQAVELGKLNLSEGLAVKISNTTGVSIGWLLKASGFFILLQKGHSKEDLDLKEGNWLIPKSDGTSPPELFTKEVFLKRVSGADSEITKLDVENRLIELTLALCSLLVKSYEKGEFKIASYKAERALSDIINSVVNPQAEYKHPRSLHFKWPSPLSAVYDWEGIYKSFSSWLESTKPPMKKAKKKYRSTVDKSKTTL